MLPVNRVADGINSAKGQRRAMRRPLRALVLTILLLEGCGGSNPARFINQTRHSDAEWWALWKAAQQNLSQQIDLNPLQRTLARVPAQMLPGDARGMECAAAAAYGFIAVDCFFDGALYSYGREPASDGADCLSAALQCELCGSLFPLYAQYVEICGIVGVCGEQFRRACAVRV